MALDRSHVSLLSLPTELWIAIGQYAIDNIDPMPWSPWISNTIIQNNRLQAPALVQVCRPIRSELLAYYYRNKTRLAVHDDNFTWVVERMGQWLRSIGSEARQSIGEAWVMSSKKEFDGFELVLREAWKGVDFEVGGLEDWTLEQEPRKRADLIAYLWRRRIVFR